MKVYVDELPKLCSYCPFYYRNSQGAVCKLSGFMARYDDEILGKMRDKCPFQSLTDYTKQVRREVCEEIKDLAGDYFDVHYCEVCGETAYNDVILTGNDLTDILDQIQGE